MSSLSQADDKKGTESLPDSAQLLAVVRRMREAPDKTCVRPSSLPSFLHACGMPGPPSRKEINQEASLLIERLWRKQGVRRLVAKSGWRGRAKPLSKKAWYACWQNKWKKDRATAAALILDGDPPKCKVPLIEIQETYEGLWEGSDGFSFLGHDGKLPTADNSGLIIPISGSEVLSCMRKMKAKGSPDMDGIKKGHLMAYDRKGRKLARLYNRWIASGCIPRCVKKTVTVLIPKDAGKSKAKVIKDWRPITLNSQLLRLFSSIWARRLGEACPAHPRQQGFIKGPGASENIAVLDGLIKSAKKNKRSLGVVFIDLARAFDTVSHSLIDEVLTRRGVDPMVRTFIGDAYRNCSSSVLTSHGPTQPIKLKRGVKQGDPLSPLLFNLALDPLLYLLEELGEGVMMGDGLKLTSMAYADDLVILSDSWKGMEKNLVILETFTQLTGLAPNPTKCHSFFLSKKERRTVLNLGNSWMLGGSPLHRATASETIKYLGIEVSPWKGVVPSPVLTQLNRLTERLDDASLWPTQKTTLLRQYVVPRLTYAATNSEPPNKELLKIDKHIKAMVKKWLHLSHFVTDGILYSRFHDGGLNFPRFATLIPAARIRKMFKLFTSEDTITSLVVKSANIEAKLRREIKLITGAAAPPDLKTFDTRLVRARTLKEVEFEKWAKQLSHGKGISVFKNDKISNHWLEDPDRCGLSHREFLGALRLRSNSTNTKTLGKGKPQEANMVSCRLCGFHKESLPHIIGNCPAVKRQRMTNHNKICRKIVGLAEAKGWRSWREKHFKLSDKTLVPDLVLARGSEAWIIDVTIVFEQDSVSLKKAAEAKEVKYRPLKEIVMRGRLSHESTKVTCIGFPLGARGKWYPLNAKLLSDLGMSKFDSLKAAKCCSKLAICGSLKTYNAHCVACES